MAEFSVKWTGLSKSANNFSGYVSDVRGYANKIKNKGSGLAFSDDVTAKIEESIGKIYDRLQNCAGTLNTMSSVLHQSAQKYKTTEASLCGHSTISVWNKKKLAAFKKGMDVASSVVEKERKTNWDYLFEAIGELGVFGSIFSTFKDGIGVMTDGVNGGTISNLLKSYVGAVGNVAGVIGKGAKANWKDLIGFSKSEDFFDDYIISGSKSAAKNISAIAKWGGMALTVVTTAYDNFTDSENEGDLGRQIKETVVESVLDIGLGTLATAICPAGGLIYVGVKWVLSLKHVDLIENVSDAIIDTTDYLVEKAADGIASLGKSVGKAAKKVGDAISGWWNGLSKAFA